MILGAYDLRDYERAYKPGDEHANVDVFSHYPLPKAPSQVPVPGETMLLTEALDLSPVTASQIKSWTTHNPVLAKVHDLLLRGWQHSDAASFAPYQCPLQELRVHDGCVLWGSVVVPPPGCERVIEELSEGHPRVSLMKTQARSIAWWPQMDQEIEDEVKTCTSCQSTTLQPLYILGNGNNIHGLEYMLTMPAPC